MDPFATTRLGPIELRNRIIKAATFEGVMPDALVTDELIEYHRAVAAGGAGMSTVAYLAVAPEGRTHAECIWLRPEAVPGLLPRLYVGLTDRRILPRRLARGLAAFSFGKPPWSKPAQ